MGNTAFASENAKAEVAAAIRAIEAVTSAEIVVAVRPTSGRYRETDYLVGFFLSFVALLVFLFDAHEFSIDWMPLDSLIAFAVGSAGSASLPTIRRLLTPRSHMLDNVRTAAFRAFVEFGVSKTQRRTGILVYASMFERAAFVVTDIGVDRAVLGAPFENAVAALDRAVRSGPSLERFLTELRALASILQKTLPRMANDDNELPDEPLA